MQQTIEENLLLASTSVNGLAVPLPAISATLAKYVTNLVAINDDPVHKVSLIGSATPLRFRDKFFVACCRHQLTNRDFSNIGLLSENGDLVTCAGARHFIHKSDSDFSDLALFDFTAPCLAHTEFQSRFFNFNAIPPDAPNIHTVFVQASGFPSADQNYELEESNHLGLKKRKVICEPVSQPADHALLHLRPQRPLGFDPDGMSGGSAFTVQLVNFVPTAFFAGMIIRAGRQDLYILKSGYIRDVMNTYVNEMAGDE